MKTELLICDCCGVEMSVCHLAGLSWESKPSVFTATCPPDGINGGQFSMDVCSTCRRNLHDAIQSVIARGRARHLRTCGTAFRGCDPKCPKEVIEEADRKSYEFRQRFACKVCGNCPDEFGELEHGRGCFVLSSDGGGSEWIDLEEETEKRPPCRE